MFFGGTPVSTGVKMPPSGRVEQRRYERVQIPQDRPLVCRGTERKLRGKVMALSQRGMFVATKDYYIHGSVVDVRVEGATARFFARCTVRDVLPEGLGLEFVVISPSDLHHVKDLIARMKFPDGPH